MKAEHPINEERAEWGARAVAASIDPTREPDEADAQDAITNILHYISQALDGPNDALEAVRIATQHFLSEIDGGDDLEQDARADWERRKAN